MADFLLVYDQAAGKVTRLTEFADSDRDVAVATRFELELLHRSDPTIEVVVLGARDEATLRKTHGRYFRSVAELLAGA